VVALIVTTEAIAAVVTNGLHKKVAINKIVSRKIEINRISPSRMHVLHVNHVSRAKHVHHVRSVQNVSSVTTSRKLQMKLTAILAANNLNAAVAVAVADADAVIEPIVQHLLRTLNCKTQTCSQRQ